MTTRLNMLKEFEAIKNSVYRRFAFTYNNYDEKGIELINKFGNDDCLYLLYEREVCPSTGTLHLQGFFIVKKNICLKHIRSKIPNKIWITPARKSTLANIMYCSKDGTGITVFNDNNFNINDYVDWEQSPWQYMWALHTSDPFNDDEWEHFNTYNNTTDIILSHQD